MPIDNIRQLGIGQIRPVGTAATPDLPPATMVSARQSLPGDGQSMPPAASAEVQQAVSRINDHIQALRRDLKFRVDQETNQVVVTVVDAQSGEVIRQIPSEEVIVVARNREQTHQGLLLNAKA
jgi:flagellar protein FlaG